MSNRLITLNPDLKKLRDEGYDIKIKSVHLLVHIPYVNSKREIAWGVLVAPLDNMAGDLVGKPKDHTLHFTGEMPCDKDGNPIKGILNKSEHKKLAEGLEVDHYFSAKPQSGNYADYYDKITTYSEIICSQVASINPEVKPQTHKPVEPDEPDSVFKYLDTNSSRAEIEAISEKLKGLIIAIIGLGGTGSYVLDFVAKTQVKEIHLFDGDTLLSHNAFRSPGAASLEILREQPKKVRYLESIYSKMRVNIIPHEYNVVASNLDELLGMNFVFVCMDGGEIKKAIIQKLVNAGIPFVDTGMGVDAIDGLLNGSLRITTVTKDKKDHIERRISFSEAGADDYDKNIQIAELNALNAALAIVKWKKLFGFYHDLEKEHQTIYNIDCNQLVNDENTIS